MLYWRAFCWVIKIQYGETQGVENFKASNRILFYKMSNFVYQTVICSAGPVIFKGD
jgi:hypothetical protein